LTLSLLIQFWLFFALFAFFAVQMPFKESDMAINVTWSVFTKSWKMPLPELGRFIKGLGFDGIELPVRPGFQVEPEKAGKDLPAAAKVLADFGVRIVSVAGSTDERTIAACGAAGIPTIRVCEHVDPKKGGYVAVEREIQARYDALVPTLRKHGVAIGVQNHCDANIASAMCVLHLIEKYDPRQVAAVWDPCHCALNGEDPELAADFLWPRLCLVNLKNAYWRLKTGPEAEVAQWEHYWTTGRCGLAPWPRVMAELKRRNYSGAVCLSAEYSDEASVNRLTAEDLAFAKSLMA
jgi:sugar phosphate isomerase/epimerase